MDLSSSYIGLDLPHPFIVGAGPISDTLDHARQAEDAGAAAIVMRSLFEEQIHSEAIATHSSTESHAHSFPEALSYFADPEDFVIGPDEYLEHLRKLKEALEIPVLASLNGYTNGGWLRHARRMAEAGADALELNLYFVATDASEAGAAIEGRFVELVRELTASVPIPIAIKLSPFYTSLANFARDLETAGARGFVLFNRFYETDIDTEELEFASHLELSRSGELRLRLRWLAILSGQLESASLAVTGGVHTPIDAVKAVMAGASAVQMVSALLQRGSGYIATMREELARWLEEREYESLAEMRGSMNILRCPDPRALARGNYMRMLQTWDLGPLTGGD